MVTWYIWLAIYTKNETLSIIWNFDLTSRGVLGRIYALSIEVLIYVFSLISVWKLMDSFVKFV